MSPWTQFEIEDFVVGRTRHPSSTPGLSRQELPNRSCLLSSSSLFVPSSGLSDRFYAVLLQPCTVVVVFWGAVRLPKFECSPQPGVSSGNRLVFRQAHETARAERATSCVLIFISALQCPVEPRSHDENTALRAAPTLHQRYTGPVPLKPLCLSHMHPSDHFPTPVCRGDCCAHRVISTVDPIR